VSVTVTRRDTGVGVVRFVLVDTTPSGALSWLGPGGPTSYDM